MVKKLRLAVLAAVVSSALVACGDSDSDSTTGISGTATKGLMQNALVVACKVKTACVDASLTELATGSVVGVLGTARTNDSGQYSMSVSKKAGPIVVRMLADADTKQKCDYTGCQETGLTGLELKTVSYVNESNKVVPLTGLSTVAAAAFLKAASNLSEDTTEDSFNASANATSSAVAKLMGINVSSGSLFELTLPSATTLEMQSATAQGSIGVDAVRQMAFLNASLGTQLDAGKSLTTASNTVSNVIQSRNSGQSVSSTDFDSLSADLNEIKAEILAAVALLNQEAAGSGVTFAAPSTTDSSSLNSVLSGTFSIPDVISKPTGATGGFEVREGSL